MITHFILRLFMRLWLIDNRRLIETRRKKTSSLMAEKVELFPLSMISTPIHTNVHQKKYSVDDYTNKISKLHVLLSKKSIKLSISFFGIFVSYLIFGILQESM